MVINIQQTKREFIAEFPSVIHYKLLITNVLMSHLDVHQWKSFKTKRVRIVSLLEQYLAQNTSDNDNPKARRRARKE